LQLFLEWTAGIPLISNNFISIALMIIAVSFDGEIFTESISLCAIRLWLARQQMIIKKIDVNFFKL
jgi:hypothetical protein